MSLESQIEAVLFWKGESVSKKELAKLLGSDVASVEKGLAELEKSLAGRGVSLVRNADEVMLYTSAESSELIKKISKEELSREISKAGIEVLSLIIYRGPISKREIDYVRGVNSNYIVRNLLVRGLIEKTEDSDGRSFMYRPTFDLLSHLGVEKREELPDFEKVQADIANFMTEHESGPKLRAADETTSGATATTDGSAENKNG
jgi:segregation and condensation protein B